MQCIDGNKISCVRFAKKKTVNIENLSYFDPYA
jgi:hypothetical protein